MRLHVTALVVAAMVAGCQQPNALAPVAQAAPPLAALPVAGVGYVLFNAPIAPESRDLLIQDMDKLREAGATEIDLAINSPGGRIDAAQDIVDYLRRMHDQHGVTFKAYNVGLVASAATYVFLNAQQRYSLSRSTFIFHAAGAISTGPGLTDAQTLREEADRLDAYEKVIRATLKARSKLSDDEAQVYLHRTVLLNATDAQRDGIIDGIAGFQLPPGARAWVIAVQPKPAGASGKPRVPATAPQPAG